MDADRSIGDLISELAAALAITGNFPEWPEKLKAFNDEEDSDLSFEDVGLKVVADLVESAVSGSEVFATYLANFIQALFAIARESEDKVGELAVAVLLCIVEEEELRTCMSIPEFASELVPILLELRFKVASDNDSDDEEDAESEAEEERDSLRLFRKAFDRVASKIGEENVKEIIFGCASEYLKKDEWRYRLVGSIAIAMAAKYLPDEGDETLLDEIVEILQVQLNDPHKRVRAVACGALAELALKYRALFQENYAKAILPLLVNLFDDAANSVKFMAMGVFQIIAEEDTEAAIPLADQLVKDFLEQVKPENPKQMRKQCIDGVSMVVDITKKEFMKYYSVVVPVIKKIIVAPSTDEEEKIRRAAIECFQQISDAVGDEMIQADADEVAQVLLRQK